MVDKITLNEILTRIDSGQSGNNNRKIDNNEEVSLFTEAAKAEGYTDDEIEAFISTTNASEESVTRNTAPLTKKDKKTKEGYVKRILQELAGNGLMSIPGMLTLRLNNVASQPYYQELLREVKSITDQVVGTINSKDDVERIHDKVKSNLKAAGKYDDFHQDVLKLVEKIAEAEQRDKEFTEVLAAFRNASDGKDLVAAFNQVEQQFKNQKSYYKDALKKLEKEYVMRDARELASDAVDTSKSETSRKVKKDAKNTLKAEHTYNKYTKKALNGETKVGSSDWFNAEDSDMKTKRKTKATDNKKERIKATPQTKEEILDALGKRKYLFDDMLTRKLIVDNEDGTYSLQPLSDKIAEFLGAELTVSSQTNDFKAISEKTKITSGIAATSDDDGLQRGLNDLSDKDAIKLVKLCGYPVDGVNVAKAILRGTIGAVIGAATTFAATKLLQNPSTSKRIGFESEHNWTKIDLSFEVDGEELELQLEDMAISADNETAADGTSTSVDIVVDGSTVIIDRLVQRPDLIVPFKGVLNKLVKNATIDAAIIGAVLGFLDGIKDKDPEKPITSTQFTDTSLNEYRRTLQNEMKNRKISPKYVDALMTIAHTFVEEDGTWNCQAYKKFLNEAAGNGSVLNRKELVMALENKRKELKKTEPDPTPVSANEPVKNNQGDPGEKFKLQTPGQEFDGNVDVIKNAGRFGWENLGKMYEDDPFAATSAFRAMEVIQAIDPNHENVKGRYNVDDINDIVRKAFPKGNGTPNGTPNWKYINDQLEKEFPQVDVARLKAVLKSPVSADETVDKKVVAPIVLYDSFDHEYRRGEPQKATPVKQTGKGNGNRFGVSTKYSTTVNGQTQYYFIDGNTKTQVSQQEYDDSKRKEINPPNK